MEAKHTPGPWRLSETASDSVVCDVNSGHDHPDVIAYYGGHLIAESIHNDANRALIAAAPDLLQALIEITDDYADRFDLDDKGTNTGIKSAIKRSREAISKATGAES